MLQGKRQRGKGRGWAWLAGGVVLFCLLVAVVVRLPPVQRGLATLVQDAVGSRITFARVVPSFIPPGLEARDVAPGVALPPGSEVEIGTIAVGLDFAALLAGEIRVRSISVRGLELVARRDRWGEVPLVAALGALGSGEGNGGGNVLDGNVSVRLRGRLRLQDEAATAIPVELDVAFDVSAEREQSKGAISFSGDGRVGDTGHIALDGQLGAGAHFAERSVSFELQAQEVPAEQLLPYLLPGDDIENAVGTISGTIHWQGDKLSEIAGPVEASLEKGGFDWLGLRFAGPVHFSSTLRLSEGEVALPDAKAQVSEIRLASLPFTNASSSFSWQSPELRFETLDATVAQGQLHYEGDARFAGDTPEYGGKLELRALQFPDLTRELAGTEDHSFRDIDAHAEFDGVVRDGTPWRKTLGGHGELRMKGGEIPVVRVLGPIFDALATGRSKRAESAATTHVDFVEETFRIQKGGLATTDVVVETNDYTLRGEGFLSLEGELDYKLKCKLTQSGTRTLLSLAHKGAHEGKSSALPAIPISVHGHVADPTVSPDLQGLSLMPFQLLLFGAKGAANLLLDVGEGGVELLNDAERARRP